MRQYRESHAECVRVGRSELQPSDLCMRAIAIIIICMLLAVYLNRSKSQGIPATSGKNINSSIDLATLL